MKRSNLIVKKLIRFALCLAVLVSSLVFTVSANSSSDVIFENGYYIETVIIEDEIIQTRGTTYTKSGTKTQTVRDSDGKALYSFTVKGTFTVNAGVSATCTSASYTYSITDDSWHFDSASTSKSGNKATATGTFKKKILLITTDTRSCTVTLECDKNGNLS